MIFLLLIQCACSPTPKVIFFPTDIDSASKGFPVATEVQKSVDPTAKLTAVFVDLIRSKDDFLISKISYSFASKNKRLFVVSVDNALHQTSLALDIAEIPPNIQTGSVLPPLSELKEISDVLNIARTNGLSEFCTLTQPEDGIVNLSVFNAPKGAIWSIVGDGWHNGDPIADFTLIIDALAAECHSVTAKDSRRD